VTEQSSERIPRPYTALAITLLAIGILLMVLSWRAFPFVFTPQLVLAILGAAASGVFSFELAGVYFSFSYLLVMCVIVLCGPAAAGLAISLTAVPVEDIRKRRPLSIMMFNVGQLVISACAGGWVYALLAGRTIQSAAGVLSPLAPSDFPRALYGMLGAAVVYAVLNLALVSIGFGVYKGSSPWAVAVSALPVLPTHIVLPFVGFLMAQVLAINAVALPLFVFPLLIARQLYQRYIGLSEAYADTIRSLVGALEAKDPYTRGHSERVSAYAGALGTAMGLDAKALARLEYAALLHDLGKLAVPGAVLTKPARLEPEEMDRIREHPARGADMVRKIPPLRDLAESVSQHHERIDGTGYPAGIRGDEMSLPARILAVADCYDAMTTTRAYRSALSRDEAIAELLAGIDGQFDGAVVRTFVEAEVAYLQHSPASHSVAPLSVDSGANSEGG